MKDRVKIVTALLLFVLLAGSAAFAAGTPKMTAFEKMLASRTISCLIGGAELEGLLIGSDAKLTIVCLDRKLGAEMMRLRPDGRDEEAYSSVPAWLRESGNYYMKRKDRTFFAVRVSAAKAWNLDLEKVRVGDYAAAKEDAEIGFLIGKFLTEDGRTFALPGGYAGEFGFYVPTGLLKPGAELSVGYEGNLKPWIVPKN